MKSSLSHTKAKAQVYGDKELPNMILMNLGGAYPDQLLTVVLKGKAKQAYSGLNGRTVCMKGELVLYKGKPEIILNNPALVQIH